MAHELTERRKRGMPQKMAQEHYAKPGTVAFGERAAERRENIKRRARKGDLRVQTAGKIVREGRDKKNRYLQGD